MQISSEKHDNYGRFKASEEVEQYLNYLRFIVRHFKDRIQYYEIWNEPNVWLPDWYIDLPDYVNLVQRSVAVIHQEYPEAKIVVGGISRQKRTPFANPKQFPLGIEYVFVNGRMVVEKGSRSVLLTANR